MGMFVHLHSLRGFRKISYRFLAKCGQSTEYVSLCLVCAGFVTIS